MISKGARVKLVSMPHDPDPVPPGTVGTVTSSRMIEGLTPRPYLQLGVSWDNGRTLGLVIPPDAVELVVEDPPKCDFCSAHGVEWVYPAKDFTLVPEYRWGSTGGWAACGTCSDLIEADDYKGLTHRSLTYIKLPDVPGFGQALANLHLDFRESRTGPRVPYAQVEGEN